MKRLRNQLQLIRHRIVYCAILITLIFMSIQAWIWILILIIYLYFLLKNQRDLLPISLIFAGIYLCSLVARLNIPLQDGAQYNVVVSKVNQIDDYTSLYARYNLHMVKVVLSEGENIKEGDHIILKGDFTEIETQTIPGNFDYRNYLLSKNIKYQIYSESYRIIEKKNYIYLPKIALKKYIDKNLEYSKRYVYTFVLADKSDFDHEVVNSISFLGLSHLFALSGMHIALLVFGIKYLLDRSLLSDIYKESTIFVFLAIFMIITSFTASVIRSGLMYVFYKLNIIFKFKLSTLDIISTTFLILLLLKPNYFYDPGFSLSYLVVYTIVLGSELLADRSRNAQLFFIGLMSLLVALPITYSFSFQINLLSLVYNVIFMYIIMFFIMPLSYILMFLPYFDTTFNIIFTYFDRLLLTLKLVNIFSFPVTFSSHYIIIIYYLSLYLAVKAIIIRKTVRRLIPIACVFLTLIFNRTFTLTDKIAFLDVKGDSIVLLDDQNQCNIVIDTGENDDYNQLLNYLKYQGLTTIDHLFITHYHADHYGEFDDIVASFNVKNIWFSDSNNLPKNGFYCGDFYIDILETQQKWANENNNSIVIYAVINNDAYLFTGDIEEDREAEIIRLYDINVNYLKVGHHGSRTSSSRAFLLEIEPNQGIIIAKKNNRHGHPHSDVIIRYDDMNISLDRTDISGTIEFNYYFKKVYKRYYRK